MGRRNYPPARLVHEASCVNAPPGLMPVPASAFRNTLDVAHDCLSREHALRNVDVVAEPPMTERHPYEPSTLLPPDATRARCKDCWGTHAEDFGEAAP